MAEKMHCAVCGEEIYRNEEMVRMDYTAVGSNEPCHPRCVMTEHEIWAWRERPEEAEEDA